MACNPVLKLWCNAAIYLTAIAVLTPLLTMSMVVFFSVDGGMPRLLQFAFGTVAAIFYSGLIISALMWLLETMRELRWHRRERVR